jgi:phosphate:Na+ symporter
MADITRIMFDETVEQFHKYDAKKSDRIQRKNEVLKVLQRDISTFLVELSRQALSIEKSIGIPVMLHLVNTLRHMGDLNETILFSLRRKKEDKINFSALAMTELKALAAIVGELVHLTVTTVGEEKYADLDIVASANNTIGKMRESMINNHIKRLTAGKCSVMAGLIYNDLVSIFSRIAEDAGNILEMEKELFDESSEGSN